MPRPTYTALANYVIAIADDQLILGHRDSEWCGHAPILEEDIAFANIALDEIGHARLWYQVAAKLLEKDPDVFPDRQVYFRDPEDFSCAQMVELPNQDWAFSMLRQYLFDSFEANVLSYLRRCAVEVVASIAKKVQIEETYHVRHTALWVKRLIQGTEESHRRMQSAWNSIEPFLDQLVYGGMPGEEELLDFPGIPLNPEKNDDWFREEVKILTGMGLKVEDRKARVAAARGVHTEYLKSLVRDLQEVAQLDPEAKW